MNFFPNGADQDSPYYMCSMTSNNADIPRFDYNRYATTKNVPAGRKGALAHRPLPPAMIDNATNTLNIRVKLNPSDAAGIYFCSAFSEGGRKTTATTVFLKSNGRFCSLTYFIVYLPFSSLVHIQILIQLCPESVPDEGRDHRGCGPDPTFTV